MLKRRMMAVIAGLALLVAVTGASGIVADSLGFSLTPQTHACEVGSSGGGC